MLKLLILIISISIIRSFTKHYACDNTAKLKFRTQPTNFDGACSTNYST